MIRAGDLHERVAFDWKVESDDGHGNTLYEWAAPEYAYECRAHFRTLRGGEVVQGARLQGQSTVVVTIRHCAKARQITADCRMRDLRNVVEYDIKGPPVLTDDRAFLEITVQSGVPS